jgi:hypothetical protein
MFQKEADDHILQIKGVLDEIKKVEGEFEKKKAENEMLQTYVNNLTRQKSVLNTWLIDVLLKSEADSKHFN